MAVQERWGLEAGRLREGTAYIASALESKVSY